MSGGAALSGKVGFNYQVVRKYLYKNGINQNTLAEAAQIKQNTLSRYLNGKSRPPEDKIMRIARVLGLPPEFLIISPGYAESAGSEKAKPERICFCPFCGKDIGGAFVVVPAETERHVG